MESLTINQFIAFWIPIHIKNKILQYLLNSILDDKYKTILFRFYDKTYSTRTIEYLKNFLPFRKDSYSIKYNSFGQSYNTYPLTIPQYHESLNIKKKMNTLLRENDIPKIINLRKQFQKEIKNMALNKETDEIRALVHSKNIDTNTLYSLEYVNKTTLENFNCGLILSEQRLIYAHHSLYESGIKSRFALYNKSLYTVVSISPLQLLWRIKFRQIQLKELKKLVKINKIVGRSEFKTHEDYITAFLAL